jgi:hypothetical protein
VPKCIALVPIPHLPVPIVTGMHMTAIIARAELEGFPPGPPAEPSMEKTSATLDALARYLDAIGSEWATISEADRLAAVRLAADTARRLYGWVATGGGSS